MRTTCQPCAMRGSSKEFCVVVSPAAIDMKHACASRAPIGLGANGFQLLNFSLVSDIPDVVPAPDSSTPGPAPAGTQFFAMQIRPRPAPGRQLQCHSLMQGSIIEALRGGAPSSVRAMDA